MLTINIEEVKRAYTKAKNDLENPEISTMEKIELKEIMLDKRAIINEHSARTI